MDEWEQARIGKITGSRMSEVVRWDWAYACALMFQRATGRNEEPVDKFLSPNDPRLRGKNLESVALGTYALKLGRRVESPGFVVHPKMPYFGATPDGIAEGVIEVKCPVPPYDQHNIAIVEGVPRQHWLQVLAQLAVTRAPWCDFVSYAPGHPLELYVYRVKLGTVLQQILGLELRIMAFELMVRDRRKGPPSLEGKLRYMQRAQEMRNEKR